MTIHGNVLMAYFAVHRTQDNEGYIGGILVIDDRGVPQEFRCTLPIRPTTTQKALYGDTLEAYMFNELIGSPLMKSLVTRPECCIVDSVTTLELREYVEMPVIHLEKYGEALSANAGSANSHRIESEIGGFQTITAKSHSGHQADYESVREAFAQMSNRIDLLEPFQRITTAFNVLTERDNRFK